MTVTLYHNPRCSKSRAALSLLQEREIQPRVVEYLKTPPTEKELRDILTQLGMSARQLLRSKEAKDAGIVVDTLSEEALIHAMCANPATLERPIIVTEKGARVGRPPEVILEVL